jgi:hypothetical protein
MNIVSPKFPREIEMPQKCPATIYLDQKDVSNLAKRKEAPVAAERFARLVRAGILTPVFSFTHVIETARDANAARRHLTCAYIDGLAHRLWLNQPSALMQMELAQCFAEFLHASPEPACPFRAHFFNTADPNLGPVDLTREFTIAVAELLSNPGLEFERIQRRVGIWPDIRRLGRARSQGRPIPVSVDRHMLTKYAPRATCAGLTVNDHVRRDFMSGLDLTRLPSTQLFFEVDAKIQADMDSTVDPGDALDHFHIRAIPYCDMTTLDARMHSIVSQTKAGKQYVGRIARNLPEALQKLGL